MRYLIVLSLLFSVFATRALPQRIASEAARPQYAAGEVLVQLEAGLWNSGQRGEVLQSAGGRLVAKLPEIRTLRIALNGGESVDMAVARIGRLPGVVSAEPNLIVRRSAVDDTYYGAQSSYLDLIEAPAAWEVSRGDDVIVAVLDSGVDSGHPDLTGRIWTNPLDAPDNGLDDDENGCIDDVIGCNFLTLTTSDPSCAAPSPTNAGDDSGHGTFVAGIIAATGNNATGVIGAAPGVRVMPVKILDCLGHGSAAEAAQGVLYAARMGARVINISFTADGDSQTMASALREAHDRYAAVIVAASGNQGEQGITFPARLPETIAVGSSGAATGKDVRSPFSDWGSGVDIVAPGFNIISTVPRALCGSWHCFTAEQPYGPGSGTSFAAPFVSALAALIISHNPNLHPETVRSMIVRAAAPLPDGGTPGWDGAGRIRMRASLDLPRYQIGAPGVIAQ